MCTCLTCVQTEKMNIYIYICMHMYRLFRFCKLCMCRKTCTSKPLFFGGPLLCLEGLLLFGRCKQDGSAQLEHEGLGAMDVGCFCVAGAALGAPQFDFAWQVQHSEQLQGGPRKSGDDWILWTPAAFAWQAQHLAMEAGCFCVAGAALGAPQSHFAWQAQHLEQLQGRPRRLDAGCFSLAGAALGALQLHFA